MSIRLFYDRWPQYNRRLVETIRPLDAEALALRAQPEHWPVWAIVGHLAGSRVYWLLPRAGRAGLGVHPVRPEPGGGLGGRARRIRGRPAELVEALETTYAIIDRVLDTWTPEMLEVEFERWYGDTRQVHTPHVDPPARC